MRAVYHMLNGDAKDTQILCLAGLHEICMLGMCKIKKWLQ